jgi:ubiquinol-cytochrome c reductase iron-sulfur subunit
MAATTFDDHGTEPTRRDFLYVATGTVAAVGGLATLVPLIGQMNPDASTLAAGGPVEFDVSKLAEGAQALVWWRSRPIYVIHRSAAAITTLQSPQLVGLLDDPDSQQLQQPPYADNWHRSAKPEIGVLVGICTHLGCLPQFFPNASPTTPVADWLGGYFCPCHGSKYDLAGRVYKNVPAPYNLPVPPYFFVDDNTLRIGENPPNVTFDFGSIKQL